MKTDNGGNVLRLDELARVKVRASIQDSGAFYTATHEPEALSTRLLAGGGRVRYGRDGVMASLTQ
jgi:hypothetical protein